MKPESTAARWLKTCSAVDANSGRKCTLLEHDPKVRRHSSSGREFVTVLGAGAQPRRELDVYARRGATP